LRDGREPRGFRPSCLEEPRARGLAASGHRTPGGEWGWRSERVGARHDRVRPPRCGRGGLRWV